MNKESFGWLICCSNNSKVTLLVEAIKDDWGAHLYLKHKYIPFRFHFRLGQGACRLLKDFFQRFE